MTNRIMNIHVIWLKEVNKMLLLQLLVQLKEYSNEKFTMNLVLNLYALEDGSHDCEFFIK